MPGFNWDLASVVQKKRESLREFIQHFCNKRNIIPEVDDKSIVMFFKKGLRYSSLIHKLTMKNTKTSERCWLLPTNMPWLKRRPSILESRGRRSQTTWINLARLRATTRKGR
jgi:hypothetical protein